MTPAKIVLLLRLSVKDQPFVNKEMNLKNVIANEKSFVFTFLALNSCKNTKVAFA